MTVSIAAKRIGPGRLILISAATAIAVLWLVPLILVIGASAKSAQQVSADGFFGLSGSLSQLLENIAAVAEMTDLWLGFRNSVIYGVLGAGIAVLLSALAAYALVWLRVWRPFFWFMLIYSGTVFPFQMYMIPLSDWYKATALYDTRVGMTIFYVAICIPFCVFVLRSYYMGMPSEMFEAAKVDGASSLRIFTHIILPQSGSPAALLFLTQFTWIWNDLLFGQVLAVSTEVRPIMPALALLAGANVTLGTVNERMAGALVASLPALVLFLALRNKFMQGFTLQLR